MYNHYIAGLLDLRRNIESRIDGEIEDVMRGRGNSEKIKESLEYLIEDSNVLNGAFKKCETIEIDR
jgi:hypothetical protein